MKRKGILTMFLRAQWMGRGRWRKRLNMADEIREEDTKALKDGSGPVGYNSGVRDLPVTRTPYDDRQLLC